MPVGAEAITIIKRTMPADMYDSRGIRNTPTEVEHSARATWYPVQGTYKTHDKDGERRQVTGKWIIWNLEPEVVPADQTNVVGDRIRDARGRLFEVIGSTHYPRSMGVCPHQEAEVARVYE